MSESREASGAGFYLFLLAVLTWMVIVARKLGRGQRVGTK
jgi:hypothetical protein